MGRTAGVKSRKWTPQEDKFLKDNFYKYSVSELAEKLDRTFKAIKQRLYTLRLNVTAFERAEREYIHANQFKKSVWAMAKELNVNYQRLRNYMIREGLGEYSSGKEFKCVPPDSCFECPYEDCLSCAGTTARETEFFKIGMIKTVGSGEAIRKWV